MPIAYLFKLNCVELAFGGAKTAADAQVVVNLRCAAAEASCGFLAYLLFGEGNTVVLPGLGKILVVLGFLTCGSIEAVERQGDVVLVELDEVAAVTGKREALSLVYEAVDGDCAFVSGCNRVDGELRARCYIAAGENIGNGGLIRLGVGKNIALFTDFKVKGL